MWIKVNFGKEPTESELSDLKAHYKGDKIEQFDNRPGIDTPYKQWIEIKDKYELEKINEDSFIIEWGFVQFLYNILSQNLLHKEPYSLIFDIGDSCIIIDHLSKSHNWNEWTNVESIQGYIFYLDTYNYRLIIECENADTVTIDLTKTKWKDI